jgi:two-component system sensor histidine kinase AlgZ
MKTPAALLAPAESRDAAAMPPPREVIPDGCNMGTVVRVALGVNLAMLVMAGTGRLPGTQLLSAFLSLAAVAEPALLLTLVIWCLMRKQLSGFALQAQRVAAWVTPAVVAVTLTRVLPASTGQFASESTLAGVALVALVLGAATQHYLELRARAFSPVLAEARFQALQSRIRPHFFFNSLNAALSVVRDDPARAERMLENIAELFRAVMGDVRKLVPLEQELDLCRKYVEIEQTRLGDRLLVDWQIGAYHPRARVPQLLLQPIIENAVRYGAEKVAGHCEIEVRVRQRGFNLEIGVSNPIAREPVQREGNQIGLTNIRGRLALVYDLEARLETRVTRDRFELTLTIPVENKANP